MLCNGDSLRRLLSGWGWLAEQRYLQPLMSKRVTLCSFLKTPAAPFRSGSERTCERLRAGIDPSQPLRCAKVRYLQDAAVGVDENVITLQSEKTVGENR